MRERIGHRFREHEIVVYLEKFWEVIELCGGAEDQWGFWYHISNNKNIVAVAEKLLRPCSQAEWDREAI